MSKFKVGDKVRIVKKVDGNYGAALWVLPMDKTIGNIGTVIEITPKGENTFYKVDVENESWNYWEDSLRKVEFTCDDIREFDIVELDNGQLLQIIYDCAYENLSISGYTIEDWDKSLKNRVLPERNIVKVYRPTNSIPTDRSKWKDLPMIWDREEVKELTVAEISKILGYKIKVVE